MDIRKLCETGLDRANRGMIEERSQGNAINEARWSGEATAYLTMLASMRTQAQNKRAAIRTAHRRLHVGEWVSPTIDEFWDGMKWVKVNTPGRCEGTGRGKVRRGWCPMRRPIKQKCARTATNTRKSKRPRRTASAVRGNVASVAVTRAGRR